MTIHVMVTTTKIVSRAVRNKNGIDCISGAINHNTNDTVGKIPNQVTIAMRNRGGCIEAGTTAEVNHASNPLKRRYYGSLSATLRIRA